MNKLKAKIIMKKIMSVITVLLMSVIVVGCGHTDDSDNSIPFKEHLITLEDGRELHCVEQIIKYRGGLSCDWENAR